MVRQHQGLDSTVEWRFGREAEDRVGWGRMVETPSLGHQDKGLKCGRSGKTLS